MRYNLNPLTKALKFALLTSGFMAANLYAAQANTQVEQTKVKASAKQTEDTNSVEEMVVYGSESTMMTPKTSNLVDSYSVPDIESTLTDDTITSLVQNIVGVSVVEDADEPRWVVIRGMDSDLNHTTIDGISVASIGQNGSGDRRVNTQLIPSDLAARTDIYKRFTARQEAGAIGGQLDIVTRRTKSNDDHYIQLRTESNYSDFDGSDGRNTLKGTDTTWGHGGRLLYRNRFGENEEFGLLMSATYQERGRPAEKRWPNRFHYFNLPENGEATYMGSMSTSLEGPPEGWDGTKVPYDFYGGSYTNLLHRSGGVAKLEWFPRFADLYVSAQAYQFRYWEDSTMNSDALYSRNNDPLEINKDTGSVLINSVYHRTRHNQWERNNKGLLSTLEYRTGDHALDVKLGVSKETFDDSQYYFEIRKYPRVNANWDYPSLYVDYAYVSDGSHKAVGVQASDGSDPFESVINLQDWEMSQAYIQSNSSSQTLVDLKLDYAFNYDDEDQGFGIAVGVENRDAELEKNLDRTHHNYFDENGKAIRLAAPYVMRSGHKPEWLSGKHEWVWLNIKDFMADVFPTFANMENNKVDALVQKSVNDSALYDYAYDEQIFDAYASLRWANENTIVEAGAKYDEVSYDAMTPQFLDGDYTENRDFTGGYDKLLPSLNITHKLNSDAKVLFSVSQTIGRPMPSHIARATKLSVGCTGGELEIEESFEDGEEGDGISSCSINMGNPDLKPREATNYDLSYRQFFMDDKAMVTLGAFYKEISNDIFDYKSVKMLEDDSRLIVRQPRNAESSQVKGLEFAFKTEGLKLGVHKFNLDFNLTHIKAEMNYLIDGENDGETINQTIDRLKDQPEWMANAGITYYIPAIDGGTRLTASYYGNYLYSQSAESRWQDVYRDERTTVNWSLWHNITDNISFKYSLYNLLDEKPTYLQTDGALDQVKQVDDYGQRFKFNATITF
ncbi:TonB-dependent receptor [Catenovulum sp. 2E275]|uniref:TonB-dependent receptor domain-containing protein n=1 Tax=Catenovulum sp. 2E275 TaxID=2980497 RepID=UPI0021D34A27|nr:TonB-dependent receptor [Catenovulum sp. 2E275]MCU4675027.1 TonB-dependent receptor [Catenovulum sp. 2E275]